MGHQSLQRWCVWLKCCLCSSHVRDLSLSPFQSAGKSAALLSSEALTTQVFVLCWFQHCHYVILKATWCGSQGSSVAASASSEYQITAVTLWPPWLFTVLLLSERQGSVPIHYCRWGGKRAGGVGSTLSHFIHPSMTPCRPPMQAGDRLWGCGRADYRPVPLGVGAILPLPLLFLSAGSEVGGGNAWEAGVICAKQGPKLEQG